MSRLDLRIRLQVEAQRQRSRRERLLEILALFVVAALATTYSRDRMAPVAAVGTVKDFGKQPVGIESERALEVRNTGRTDLHVQSVAIPGDVRQAFFLGKDDCSHAALASGGSCELTVGFRPQTEGAQQATLTIVDNSAGSPHAVTLTGTGTVTGPVAPPSTPQGVASIDRREVLLRAEVGLKADQELHVSNIGAGALNLMEVSFSGDHGDFSVDQSGCAGGPIAAGGGCPLRVSFTPQRAGSQAATLSIAHDSHGSPLLVSLQGIGIGPPEGYCCIKGQEVKLNTILCAQRRGEFSSDPVELARRCAPPDVTPPPVPQPLQPGERSAPKAQNLFPCTAVTLAWRAVDDPSRPVRYIVALENGRGLATDSAPREWAVVFDRQIAGAPKLDVSSWCAAILRPTAQSLGVVRPPLVSLETNPGERGRFTGSNPPVIAFPAFRWRVSARDGAGNESSASSWMYFSCWQPVEPPRPVTTPPRQPPREPPTPILVPQPIQRPPPQETVGWCCAAGETFKGTAAQCRERNGQIFTSAQEADRVCHPARGGGGTGPQHPLEGWCCAAGKTFPGTAVECRERNGQLFTSKQEADRVCHPAGTPFGPNTGRGFNPAPVVGCCLGGRFVAGVSQPECTRQRGAFMTQTEAAKNCRQRPSG